MTVRLDIDFPAQVKIREDLLNLEFKGGTGRGVHLNGQFDPRLSCSAERSWGMIFEPKRFRSSGGITPFTRNTLVVGASTTAPAGVDVSPDSGLPKVNADGAGIASRVVACTTVALDAIALARSALARSFLGPPSTPS